MSSNDLTAPPLVAVPPELPRAYNRRRPVKRKESVPRERKANDEPENLALPRDNKNDSQVDRYV